MPEFQFPNPAEQTTVTNAETGTTYQWKADPGKWVIVKAEAEDNSGVIDDLTQQVSDNTANISSNTSANSRQDTALENLAMENGDHESRITTLELRPEAVTYQIGTDKVMRAGEPSIELVDSEGYYTNVKFQGRNGISTSSDLINIIIDASALETRLAAAEEAIATLTGLVPPADIGNVTITSTADVPGEGNAATGQGDLFIMTAINDGESQHGLRYNWTVKRGNGRISGSTTEQSCAAMCNDPAPSTVEFQCVVSHPTVAEETKIASLLVLVADDG